MTHEQSAKSNGVCLATLTNILKKYFKGGIDAVTKFKRNVNSDNARRVLDGRAEARIIELACGSVSEGHRIGSCCNAKYQRVSTLAFRCTSKDG